MAKGPDRPPPDLRADKGPPPLGPGFPQAMPSAPAPERMGNSTENPWVRPAEPSGFPALDGSESGSRKLGNLGIALQAMGNRPAGRGESPASAGQKPAESPRRGAPRAARPARSGPCSNRLKRAEEWLRCDEGSCGKGGIGWPEAGRSGSSINHNARRPHYSGLLVAKATFQIFAARHISRTATTERYSASWSPRSTTA
jgi:hypothetical protein